MMEKLMPYVLCFIPIFIAAGVVGNIPFFISLTEGLDRAQKKRVARNSSIAAALIAIAFLFIGKALFSILGVTESDFRIGGGIVLLVLSINLLLPGQRRTPPSTEVGVFPLATPIITGPAVLTLTIILSNLYGVIPVLVSILLNMVIIWILFFFSESFERVLGSTMLKAFSKVMDIILAAFAVMLIRNGIIDFLKEIGKI